MKSRVRKLFIALAVPVFLNFPLFPAFAQTFTALHNFGALNENGSPPFTNSDGYGPNALILIGNKLYGIAAAGGAFGYGTFFSINEDGTSFTNLYNFDGSIGQPHGNLVALGNTVYGA